jgi:hypothetical protein
MRPTIALLLLAATTGVAAQNAANTHVPKSQIAAVSRDVAGWHDRQHPECRFTKVLGSSVIEVEDGDATEKWTIEGCDGRQFSYQVFVMPGADGSVVDMVSNLDETPMAGEEADADADAEAPMDAAACAAQQAQADKLMASSNKEDVAKGVAMIADLAGSTCPEPGA